MVGVMILDFGRTLTAYIIGIALWDFYLVGATFYKKGNPKNKRLLILIPVTIFVISMFISKYIPIPVH